MRDRIDKGDFLKPLFGVELLAFVAGALANTFFDAVFSYYEVTPTGRAGWSIIGFGICAFGVLASRTLLTVQYIELSKNLDPIIEAKVAERCQLQGNRVRPPSSSPPELLQTQF